ncbi:MAG: hypothetical protein R2873_24410 [Caldilineaceae bacterium]|nr:hypothetical protein [Caldilineaceae bacterium]
MARKTGEQLKEGLLLLFIAVSVVLVGLTWAEGLAEPADTAPRYYHGAPPVERSTALPQVTVTPRQHRHTVTPTTTTTPAQTPTADTTPPHSPTTLAPTATLGNLPEPTVDPFDVTQDE